MKKIITLLALATMLFTSTANAKKYIELEDNSQILGKWKLYAETAALHKTKKMVQNEWIFRDNGILTSVAFDPRLDGKKSINVTYKVEDGVIKKQVQPGRDKVENCKVVKLEGDDMILHCRFLYYLLRR
ncbi:MAG: hypothetical protein methR_P2142 [Methyloprofundus sp.]|nr:MAG: hypothetical protein methR_P2142 [Methyloprofundus sp.]